MGQEKSRLKKNRDFFTTGEERGTIGGEKRERKEFSAMKKQEKTAKITESGHSSVTEPGVTVTGTSRDNHDAVT